MRTHFIRYLFPFFFCLTLCSPADAQRKGNTVTKDKVSTQSQKSSAIKTDSASQPEQSKQLTNAGVIKMAKAGFAESIILNAIQTNETQFDVSMNALFELKNAGVSQKIMEAMQLAVTDNRQVQTPKTTDSKPQQTSQPSRSDTTKISVDQGLPTYGTVKDIKNFNRIYISVENVQSRERIVKALGKAPHYQIVSDPQDAQIFLEYKVLSRDNNSDTNDTDLRIKSQMNAIVIKGNKRVIVWSDTADHVRKTLGGVGWRSDHNEIKLSERFLKAIKD